jgi:phosphatidylinositol glycan class P protein
MRSTLPANAASSSVPARPRVRPSVHPSVHVHALTRPRAHPPTRTSAGVAFALYLLWAYVPDDALRAMGVAYAPDKYWAVALPTWAGVALVYAAVAYESLSMLDVKRPEDLDGMEERNDAPGAIPRKSRGDDPEVRARRGANRLLRPSPLVSRLAASARPSPSWPLLLTATDSLVASSASRTLPPSPASGSRACDQGPASVRGVPGVISRARGAAARAAASGGGPSVTARRVPGGCVRGGGGGAGTTTTRARRVRRSRVRPREIA